ncbi:lanthionine synthetase LanC family protein, partial [Actinokineospora enzanensis]|uniref:lanthionine synthetase LanC family protein n=1 Tax=Actinokineospora enzanensis TaxID=155975 RepID=UPI00038041E7
MIPDALTLPPAEAPSPHWHQDLAVGAPGIVLLHAERARVTGDDHTLHRWVSAMMASPLHAHQRTGLYQGAPAAVHALHAATCPGQPTHQAYTTASAALEHQVAQLIRDRLAQADDRLARGELPTFREFDLISGLTGLGVLLVH